MKIAMLARNAELYSHPRLVEAADNRRIDIEHLIFVRPGAPCRADSLGGE